MSNRCQAYRQILVRPEILRAYEELMSCETLDYEKHDIQRYSTIKSWAVDFGEGYEADVKVCSSNDGDPLWCEAVLFKNGSEVACSEVCDTLWDQRFEFVVGNTHPCKFILEVHAMP